MKLPAEKERLKKKAFTLTEVLVAVIIIGILVIIALPNVIKAMENTKAKEAIVSLRQIRQGEIIYRGEENSYWPAGPTETDVPTINARLRLFLDTRELNWDYYVTATADTFIATAERKSGRYKGKTIVINQDGIQTGYGMQSGYGFSTWPLSLY